MSKFINYYMEEENKTVIENDHGFSCYSVIGNECFVTDMFVEKEHRDKGYGLDLASKLLEAAINNKCDFMTCNIFLDPHNRDRATRKISLFSKFGFQIVSAGSDVITMKKGL